MFILIILACHHTRRSLEIPRSSSISEIMWLPHMGEGSWHRVYKSSLLLDNKSLAIEANNCSITKDHRLRNETFLLKCFREFPGYHQLAKVIVSLLSPNYESSCSSIRIFDQDVNVLPNKELTIPWEPINLFWFREALIWPELVIQIKKICPSNKGAPGVRDKVSP